MAASQSNPSDPASRTPSRIKHTLLPNPAVDGNDAIVELIIANGSLGEIPAGTEFITIGPSNDEVYFLLSGTADVYLADGRSVCRTTPKVSFLFDENQRFMRRFISAAAQNALPSRGQDA